MKPFLNLFFGLFSFFVFSQQSDNVNFKSAFVDLSFNTSEKLVMGNLTYEFEILKPVDSIYLDAVGMIFKNVKLNKSTAKWDNDGDKFWLLERLVPNKKYQLSFTYQVSPKKALYFVGWDNEAPNQIWTQGQGKYTSHWLPSLDDTNDKIEFDLQVTFDKAYEVVANGALVNKTEKNGKITWTYDMERPMSSYLVALAIGDYDKKEEISKSGKPLEMYYYPKDSMRVEPTYRFSKTMFDFLESEIGVAYPWQNYKQIPVHDFLYAGMENTSTTIFADSFVIDSISFVDKNYVNVNAHELAHQWFGDYVTAKNGDHHWLQEGFATYYALLAEREVFGEHYYFQRLYEYYQELMQQERVGQGTSLLNPKSSSLTFYKHGAWVLHALKDKVGDEAFEKAVRNYLNKHAYSLVETNDFISEVEQASGLNLHGFQLLWIENVKFPQEQAYELLMKSAYIQEYEMADCEMNSGKCVYYLNSGVSDWTKSKVIAQVPDKVTVDLFNSGWEVRQAIAESVSKIPQNLKESYESLLNDPSYKTIEAALYHLWINFPEDRATYFKQTEDLVGFPDKNIRLLWLALALSSPNFEPENNETYFYELLDYTSPRFGFEVRLSAFQYLEALKGCNDMCQDHLKQATKHHNWRMSKFAKEMLERLKPVQN